MNRKDQFLTRHSLVVAYMGSPRKTLVLSKSFMLIILLGTIGIVAAPFTQYLSPVYPVYHVQVFEKNVVLNDDSSIMEFGYGPSDKVVIEELITNGSPVVIQLFVGSLPNVTQSTIQNVTEIRGVYLAGANLSAYFRISSYENQPVRFDLLIRVWGTHLSTDNIAPGLSVFVFLAIPLVYFIVRHWDVLPTRRGYAVILMVVLSAALITPPLIYTYNGWGSILRSDEVQTTRSYSFSLNASNPLHEFNLSLDSIDSNSFIRIANFSTNSVPVAVAIMTDRDGVALGLTNVTTFSSGILQFELSRENVTNLTVQLRHITQDATISLSVETVTDVWAPWIGPLPFYLSAAVGVVLLVIALITPRETSPQL